mgnify:CR=1 FL=1
MIGISKSRLTRLCRRSFRSSSLLESEKTIKECHLVMGQFSQLPGAEIPLFSSIPSYLTREPDRDISYRVSRFYEFDSNMACIDDEVAQGAKIQPLGTLRTSSIIKTGAIPIPIIFVLVHIRL